MYKQKFVNCLSSRRRNDTMFNWYDNQETLNGEHFVVPWIAEKLKSSVFSLNAQEQYDTQRYSSEWIRSLWGESTVSFARSTRMEQWELFNKTKLIYITREFVRVARGLHYFFRSNANIPKWSKLLGVKHCRNRLKYIENSNWRFQYRKKISMFLNDTQLFASRRKYFANREGSRLKSFQLEISGSREATATPNRRILRSNANIRNF